MLGRASDLRLALFNCSLFAGSPGVEGLKGDIGNDGLGGSKGLPGLAGKKGESVSSFTM